MCCKLDEVLKRIDSRLLANWWSFYRDYFQNDELCLQFIFDAVLREPVEDGQVYCEKEDEPGTFVSDSGAIICDDVFIPRRMLNAVERFVTVARDMEMIRHGKDVFKVVFLVTCVETLQKLKGQEGTKKDLLFAFFNENTSDEDREFIRKRFRHDDECEKCGEDSEDSFQQFIGVLNEYRNCAAHEGEYWEYCFSNEDDEPSLLCIKIDLDNYSQNKTKKKDHCFTTQISYPSFEKIFVRTCITFIQKHM